MAERLLYIPNTIVVDNALNPQSAYNSAIQVIEKISENLPVIFLEQISIEDAFEYDYSPLIERDQYQVFKSKDFTSPDNKLLSFQTGAVNAYKIACLPGMFRKAFIHVYDIMGEQIPMVVLANNFVSHTQAFTQIVEDKICIDDSIIQENQYICTIDEFVKERVRLIDNKLTYQMV